MPAAIHQLRSRLRVGHARLGAYGPGIATPRQAIHDGDTLYVQAVGNLGIRFLGVDAPEMSFTLPGGSSFVRVEDARWDGFLGDPFDPDLPPFDPPLDRGLRAHLRRRIGPGCANNHARFAEEAQRELERQVEGDLDRLSQSKEEFQFFLAFAGEVMDRYGRLLAYLNRQQPDPSMPEPRPPTYNERLLQSGLVSPYFIWPNINPFRASQSVEAAAARLPPGSAQNVAEAEVTLRTARDWVRRARSEKIGLFADPDPLRLQPFELRFLARREPPDRWVIDLGKDNSVLVAPQKYYTVRNLEDRLYIPGEYVPLFLRNGWQLPT
jgi:endonuclease YncB( thermonuclease family)